MTRPNDVSDRPLRRVPTWKVFGIFCLVAFAILAGVVFIPWDVQAPDDADLLFKAAAITPEKNAFVWFEKAAKLEVRDFVDAGGQKRELSKVLGSIGEESEEWDPVFVDQVLAANAAVFPELENGLACRHYVPPRPEGLSYFETPWLYTHEWLVALLRLKSKQAQLAGDFEASAKSGLQALSVGQLLAAGSNSSLQWLVGIVSQRIALNRLEELVADARTPEAVQLEILTVLNQWNTDGLVDGYRNAMRGEYSVIAPMVKAFAAGKSQAECFQDYQVARFIPYLFKPNMTNREFAAFYRYRISVANQPDMNIKAYYGGLFSYPKSTRKWIHFYARPNSKGLLFVEENLPSVIAVGDEIHLQAWIAALRLKIALRQYGQKQGRLPTDLGALVPEFLPAVPNDPFDGKPFRYSFEKKLVWLVGRDGIDNGGKTDKGEIMNRYKKGNDAVMPLGIRELKPNLAPSAQK